MCTWLRVFSACCSYCLEFVNCSVFCSVVWLSVFLVSCGCFLVVCFSSFVLWLGQFRCDHALAVFSYILLLSDLAVFAAVGICLWFLGRVGGRCA